MYKRQVMIPLISSADSHQQANARSFPGRGTIINEESPTAQKDTTHAIKLMCKEALTTNAEKQQETEVPNAALAIAESIQQSL